MSLRGWKWWGMKKLCFVDFAGGFLKFVPPFFGNGAIFRDRLVSEGLCVDPRVKPEDDDLLGVAEGILLTRCAMEAVEEDTTRSPHSVILGLDPRIESQASKCNVLSPP